VHIIGLVTWAESLPGVAVRPEDLLPLALYAHDTCMSCRLPRALSHHMGDETKGTPLYTLQAEHVRPHSLTVGPVATTSPLPAYMKHSTLWMWQGCSRLPLLMRVRVTTRPGTGPTGRGTATPDTDTGEQSV
jgi:hypothetical protein